MGASFSTSPTEQPELFYGAIGGYGAIGVIADVTLDLTENVRVRRDDTTLAVASYPGYFNAHIRNDSNAVFHNADMYPPNFNTVHAVSYRKTTDQVTIGEHIQPADQAAWTHRLAYRMMSSSNAGLWTREHLLDPWLFRGNPVTWRNYEASYDVSELEPTSRRQTTYVLQEYFVPVDSFTTFVPHMRSILRAHRVNAINVSVRHALADPGTLLAWAPTEVFAFVLYYRQETTPDARREVARWTRELIDAVIQSGGRYYLPYQPAATRVQFNRAYPRAAELFALKQRVDPTHKFTNVLWDLYAPSANGVMAPVTASRMPAVLPAEVQIALDTMRAYERSQGAEYLTHPEWDLVYGSEAYERWLTEGRTPSAFPYIRSVGTFWRSYMGTWHASRDVYPADIGTHVMLGVIGISTAVEYGLKNVYEGTIGWLSERARPADGTAEERYAASVAREYDELIKQRGWYEFDFVHALSGLWTTVPANGPGLVRKWERRFALSAEYGIKAVYAWLIKLGTQSTYAPDALDRGIVVAGWSDSGMANSVSPSGPIRVAAWLDRGYALLSVPRYAPFRDELLTLADHTHDVRIAEVAGCDVVTLTGTAPATWRPPARSKVIVAYEVPTEPSRVRVVLGVRARDLLDVLALLKRDGTFRTDHISRLLGVGHFGDLTDHATHLND